MRRIAAKATALIAPLFLVACNGIPEGLTPVSNFDVNRYMGTWYEIARLDHSFERGMDQVTATYSLNDDGTVKVVNKGYVAKKDKWKSATGKARFEGDTDTGFLGVSFFGPFYSSYVIYELGDNYDYAFVAGYNTDYLWFLSRTPQVSDELLGRFRSQAAELGFNVDELILVEQGK